MGKCYAVRKGRNVGIYDVWKECAGQIRGFKGAEFKAFETKKEAENYLNCQDSGDCILKLNKCVEAYVDGSYDSATKRYSYGIVMLDGDNVTQLNGVSRDGDNTSSRNVAGEVTGAMVAVREAVSKEYKQIIIYYDYEGIEKWATGKWKTNLDLTKLYKKTMLEFVKKIKVDFVKVIAHSGNQYNDMADRLAKNALGLK